MVSNSLFSSFLLPHSVSLSIVFYILYTYENILYSAYLSLSSFFLSCLYLWIIPMSLGKWNTVQRRAFLAFQNASFSGVSEREFFWCFRKRVFLVFQNASFPGVSEREFFWCFRTRSFLVFQNASFSGVLEREFSWCFRTRPFRFMMRSFTYRIMQPVWCQSLVHQKGRL